MINLSLFLLIGLLLAAFLALRPKFLSITLVIIYWSTLLFWSLNWLPIFNFKTIYWSNLLNIGFSYHIDGLARLFTLLIAGIGILIFIYAVVYAQQNLAKRAKLLALLQVFAISMLSIVLTDNMIVLFLAWELTTVTSYLLIQFDVKDASANQAAFNGMFISVLGGLAMLVGFILLQQLSNSWLISTSIIQLANSSSHSLFAIFCLILLGAVTKSAQFPFYFWLPGAMKAPTPVSAYLHSATMVNAGIYLLARLHPLFINLAFWYPFLAFFGLSTMLISAILSLFQRDLKAILAYTTLFALGSMVYLLGSDQWLAAEAFAIFLLFHAIYKAAAFMLVGTLDKEYKTRDIQQLKGIARQRPGIAILSIIILGSMAGLPPFFGFVVKEMIYEAKLAAGSISFFLMGISILSSMLIATASFRCGWYFFAAKNNNLQRLKLNFGLVCPIILAIIIVLLSFIYSQLKNLIQQTATAIVPNQNHIFISPSDLQSLSLSLITVFGGIVFLLLVLSLKNKRFYWPNILNPGYIFETSLTLILRFGRYFTYITQRQTLSLQLKLILLSLFVLLLITSLPLWSSIKSITIANNNVAQITLSLLLIGCGISLVYFRVLLINLISLGLIGLLISTLFITQGAPDVAMTQLLIEILTVVIVLIALRKSKFIFIKEKESNRLTNLLLALGIGSLVTIILFLVTSLPFNTKLQNFFIANSLPLAYGKNVVNVILVDFRALDTLGEVLVILATAVGIWLLIKKETFLPSKADKKLISILLKASTRFIVQIMLLLSILLVFRGHNYPGGGFIGALVATAASGLYTLAFGLKKTPFDYYAPKVLIVGILCLLLSALLPLYLHQPFLTGVWWKFSLLGKEIKLGSPLIFDFGIYFIIFGSLSWLLAELEDKQT